MARMSMADRLKQSGGATVEKLEDASKRLKKQSLNKSDDQQTIEQPDERPNEHSNKHSNGQSGGHSIGQSNSLADTLAVSLADTRAVSLAGGPPNSHVSSPTGSLMDTLSGGPGHDPYYWMTPNQEKVLIFLSRESITRTRLSDIVSNTGVAYGTVRRSLKLLCKQNCITNPKKMRIGQWQGFQVELLEDGRRWVDFKCKQLGITADSLMDTLTDTLVSGLTDGQSDEHSNEQSPYISSSSVYNKPTTKSKLGEIIKNHPELGYWRDKGIQPKLIESWANEFQTSYDEIIQGLCHCQFEMVVNDLENKKSIGNVFDWFYKIYQKSGFYPKPQNYKSHIELKIEREKKILEDLQRQTQELVQLRNERIKAEHKLSFEKMLADEDSADFIQCFEKIANIFKHPGKRGSLGFINQMKRAYCELHDIEQF